MNPPLVYTKKKSPVQRIFVPGIFMLPLWLRLRVAMRLLAHRVGLSFSRYSFSVEARAHAEGVRIGFVPPRAIRAAKARQIVTEGDPPTDEVR